MIALLITLYHSNILSIICLSRVKQAEKNEEDRYGERERKERVVSTVSGSLILGSLWGVILGSSSEPGKIAGVHVFAPFS